MKAALISVSADGRELSKKIETALQPMLTKRFVFEKYADNDSEKFSDIGELTAQIFGEYNAMIFVCACGIAVRAIAPHIRSKTTDPAVVVVDDSGKFAIPILSGHIGGANCIADLISEGIGAEAVITTATDIRNKFSPDLFAKANNLILDDLEAAKEIAAAVLRGEKIGYMAHGCPIEDDFDLDEFSALFSPSNNCRAGIVICPHPLYEPIKPFEVTLNLFPRNVILGIGCKKNTPLDVMEKQIFTVLENAKIDFRRVRKIASADIKRNEDGLHEFAEKYKLETEFFTAGELMSASGDFSGSEFVLETTGADNICERAAALAADGGYLEASQYFKHSDLLILRKTLANGVTVAAAIDKVKICLKKK